MKYNWINNEYNLKFKIITYIKKFKENECHLSLLVENLNPYDIINDSSDVFLYCALLNCEEICVYWVKNGYRNRYFKDNKCTLYYLLTIIKNIKIIDEVFIYWKLNDINFFKLFFENFDISDNQLMILFYYMNNSICPCKMMVNNHDMIGYLYTLKNDKSCLCGECIVKIVNNDKHDCITIRNIFENNKHIISFLCQIINCKSCLNYFLSKNTNDIKKILHINNRKLYFKVIYYRSVITKIHGTFEDCIDLDNINENEKFYKCTSNVPHYYKENNWLKWCNYNEHTKTCCVCKLEMNKKLCINSQDDKDFYSYIKRDYSIANKHNEEKDNMYIVNINE